MYKIREILQGGARTNCLVGLKPLFVYNFHRHVHNNQNIVLSVVEKTRGTENGYMHKKIHRTNCLLSDSLGLEIRVICPIVRFLGN